MSERFRRLVSGLFTGYAALFLNIAYTILSVPMALHYLSKSEFGLWALSLQISGYLMLLDLGVSPALNRLLANHKNGIHDGIYGSFLLTGGLVFMIQGLLIAVGGTFFSLIAPNIFTIPTELQSTFRNVLLILTIYSALFYSFRFVSAPLWTFQRIDIINTSAIITLFVNFFSLWLGFILGMGIYSFATAGILSGILRISFESIVCLKCGYYPGIGEWGRPSWKIFREVFGFGKDVLLMSLGGQLVNASQLLIVSRCVGLDAAATFSIGTKLYNMGTQLVSKFMETSTPGLIDMFIHDDIERLNRRFWNIVSLSIFASTLFGGVVIMSNHTIVEIWTSKIIVWSPKADILIGGLIFLTSISRCFVSFFGVIGNYGPVKYIYLLEGGGFLLLAIPAAKYFGINGVLAASLIAHLATSFLISLLASPKQLNSRYKIGEYLIPSFLLLTGVSIISLIAQESGISCTTNIVLTFVVGVATAWAGWKYLLDKEFRGEILNKLETLTFR
jgi:O-antigen/teichoic acid export membrane protein